MFNSKNYFLIMISISGIASFYPAAILGNEPNAQELVRTVRESENWIHSVQSLYLRLDSKWTRVPGEHLTVGAELGASCEEGCSPAEKLPQLQPSTEGFLEYAFDEGRVRFLNQESGQGHQLTIWDGKKLISHENYTAINQESYTLNWTPQGSFSELISFQTSWPRAQPHSMWWDQKDVDECLGYYGRPEEFKLIGRCDYRGIDCYELEFYPKDLLGIVVGQPHQCDAGIEYRLKYGYIGEARGLADQFYRWYVGTEDRFLYGIVWLVSRKPHVEHWMKDYKKVAEGCWLPMTQGYELYARDADGEAYVETRRELKVTDVGLNEKLPDDLFRIEMKAGVEIVDNRSGRSMTYIYEPEPPALVGKTLPDLSSFKCKFNSEPAPNARTLVCFWDMQQRPSRHCILQLNKMVKELAAKNVSLVTVHTKTDENTLNQWKTENHIEFPVAMIQADEEHTCRNWGVRSFPWLILTDKQHIVLAEGFAVSELNDKI